MSDKLMFILDNPVECRKCPLFKEESRIYCTCSITGESVHRYKKSDFCPLKPLPKFLSTEHVDYAHEASEINGWNKCLESLLDDDLK